jgi:aconitate hydratase A / 2-methylisocitrate dehydratase
VSSFPEAAARLEAGGSTHDYVRLDAVVSGMERLPRTVKILLENLLRRAGSRDVSEADVRALAKWPEEPSGEGGAIAFMPSRVLMQDFTGVPAVVDLAAMRSSMDRAGGDPSRVNPLVPVDLIVDHSVQVDAFGQPRAFEINVDWEYRRNAERYRLLKWAQQAFDGFRVVPPGMGICHQVNLEHLARVVQVRDGVAMPDTLVGTDSHTTMVNGLGVLGWGVGGIEAEAAMLGQPMFLPWPIVTGVRMSGALPTGTTATDLVLTLTEMLRKHGVVGKLVEFFGAGLSSLTVEDRATLSNMCPEYGATAAYFPVDEQSLKYLRNTGREDAVELVERYTKEQALFRTDDDPDPEFSEVLELDLSTVEPSLAGPRRPQDRVSLSEVWPSCMSAFSQLQDEDETRAHDEEEGFGTSFAESRLESEREAGAVGEQAAEQVRNGSVVIAAITSCTNTSNPSVMIGAGLLAKKAVEAGLQSMPWVKTSLAPGSKVVTEYLDRAGLQPYLDKLGFSLVGYGCTTCIGNSGPLPDEVAKRVDENDLVVAAVLSGNRNFEGRIHPQVKASYLASPPLCVAFALAGRVDVDLTTEPLGTGSEGPVYLRDLWPSSEEIQALIADAITPQEFEDEYGRIFDGDDRWRELDAPTGSMFEWDASSTYVQEPPFFQDVTAHDAPGDIEGARVLVKVGDSITTDHISPAGSIKKDSPAGQWLIAQGVESLEFNSYGSRRGNHEVMMRGTFANIRLRNEIAPGTEGWWTQHLPDGEQTPIYDAAMRYGEEGVPLLVVAGKEYGSGSSRDWAAKGPSLLGVRAVIAESFERIHRSNLVGMGVLPLQFAAGESAESLGLTGRETYTVRGLESVKPGQEATVDVTGDDGASKRFKVLVRIDEPAEVDYYNAGGILQMVLARMLSG